MPRSSDRRPLVALWLLVAAPHSHALEAASDTDWLALTNSTVRVVDECFYKDSSYTPISPSTESDGCYPDVDMITCKLRCVQNSACMFFNFIQKTGRCCLAGSDAYFQASPGSGSFSGIKSCDSSKGNPSCRENPNANFPGATQEASMLAWPTHRVPQKFECWPKNWEDKSLQPCDKVTVLEDSERGFPGKCLGLQEIPVVPIMETCETSCRKASFCSVFQTVQKDPPYGPRTCYHGYASTGHDCYANRENFKPVRAKRFMQGTIHVIRNVTDYQIVGLANVFKPYYFINATSAVQACRNQCYSGILCQYWQYLTHTGCWMEEPALLPPLLFPPTTQVWHPDPELNKFIAAGEYIQHLCAAVRGSVDHELLTTPVETFRGSMAVLGISYEDLSDTERTALRKVWAQDVARFAEVPVDSISDLQGEAGAVTIKPFKDKATAGEAANGPHKVMAQYIVDLTNPSSDERVKVETALSSPEFLQLVSTGTATYLTQSRSGAAQVSPQIFTEAVHSEHQDPLPTYVTQIVWAMFAAVCFAGIGGYVWVKVLRQEDDSDAEDSPVGSAGSASPIKAALVQGGAAAAAGARGLRAGGQAAARIVTRPDTASHQQPQEQGYSKQALMANAHRDPFRGP